MSAGGSRRRRRYQAPVAIVSNCRQQLLAVLFAAVNCVRNRALMMTTTIKPALSLSNARKNKVRTRFLRQPTPKVILRTSRVVKKSTLAIVEKRKRKEAERAPFFCSTLYHARRHFEYVSAIVDGQNRIIHANH